VRVVAIEDDLGQLERSLEALGGRSTDTRVQS
jgi:hypothetical protein